MKNKLIIFTLTVVMVVTSMATAFACERTNETYTVNYLNENGESLLESKVVSNVKAGDVVTETAPFIEGYKVVGSDTQNFTVKQTQFTKVTPFRLYGWARVTPCYKLNWCKGSIVVVKKGNQYVVWTYDKLNASEQRAVYDSFRANVNGMNGAKFANTTFVYGLNAYYAGMRFGYGLSFDKHSTWSIFATGCYTSAKTETYTEGENVINFYYEKDTEVTYTVKYIDIATGMQMMPDKVVTAHVGDVTTENTPSIDGYYSVTGSTTFKVAGGEVVYCFYEEIAFDD